MNFRPQTFLNPLKSKITGFPCPPTSAKSRAKPSRATQCRGAFPHSAHAGSAGCVAIENGNFKLETALTDFERKREALLQPLAQEGIELWLELCHFKKKFDDAFDEIEAMCEPKQTERVKSGKKPSLSLHLLDRSVHLPGNVWTPSALKKTSCWRLKV